MFLENSFAGAGSHFSQLSVIGLFDGLNYVLRALGHQHFFSHSENSVQSGPWIGNNRASTAGGLEQPNRWRVSPFNHSLARQIEREP